MSSETYVLSGWLFLRLLGLIYFTAFVSLGVQIKGLVGSRGILPARDFLLAKKSLRSRRYLEVPTLCWLNASDAFLQSLCWCGSVFALLLTIGLAPVVTLILLWLFYLSLFNVCRVFLSYQWDILILETGFLAIFAAPFELWPKFPPAIAPSPVVLGLLWWLVFRLMFSSGFVKFRSGDRTWRSLSAFRYHFETQPLPPWTAWHLHRLPGWFQRMSAVVLFLIELGMPAFVFAPPPFSYIAGTAFIFLMFLIMATGNYCFFNWLGIALSVLLFDDAFWLGLLRRFAPGFQPATAIQFPGWPWWITIPVAIIVVLLSVDVVGRLFRYSTSWPKQIGRIVDGLESFRLVNGYGLFSVMTTERPEIIVEGSNDGVNWLAYEFRWKPGGVNRRPRFVAPHQPRLDWQMWFAALGTYQSNPWFGRFLLCLLRGSPDVSGLLRSNPFPDQPPRFVRGAIYDYRFTDAATRRRTGAWWRRERRGLYGPVLSLDR